MLVAVGRKTVIEDLNLDATGVEVDERGIVQVDGYGRTAEDGVYAAGDVVGVSGSPTRPDTRVSSPSSTWPARTRCPRTGTSSRVTFCRPEVASSGSPRRRPRRKVTRSGRRSFRSWL